MLGARNLAVLASAGLLRADVHADPRIVIVATGDELVAPDEPIEAWQVRRSNSHALRGALNLRGFQRVAEDHLPDDRAVLAKRLSRHLATHDVVLLTGGVSMGRFDHVPSVLRELGVAEVFHKVAQRPGKPIWFGIGLSGQTVFGLPGNPSPRSSACCAMRCPRSTECSAHVRGRPNTCPSAPHTVKDGLWHFLPVRIEQSPALGRVAMPRPTRGSGDFVSLLGTDGFVELPPGPRELQAGFIAPLYRW